MCPINAPCTCHTITLTKCCTCHFRLMDTTLRQLQRTVAFMWECSFSRAVTITKAVCRFTPQSIRTIESPRSTTWAISSNGATRSWPHSTPPLHCSLWVPRNNQRTRREARLSSTKLKVSKSYTSRLMLCYYRRPSTNVATLSLPHSQSSIRRLWLLVRRRALSRGRIEQVRC